MNICALLCEARGNYYQFAKVGCNIDHDKNNCTFITVSSCGQNNKGRSAFGFSGKGNFYINYFNSSNNRNDDGSTQSYGTCYRTGSILTHRVKFFNFVNSIGYDVFNTYFADVISENQSILEYGNIYNCTTYTIFRFCGTNIMDHIRFGNLVYQKSFESGSGLPDTLDIFNSIFEQKPIVYEPKISFGTGIKYINPVPLYTDMLFEKIDRCLFPSQPFSESVEFTSSNIFTPSNVFTHSEKFTMTYLFSPSRKFSQSKVFSHSKMFSKSKFFSPSKGFTLSSLFSPSDEFTTSNDFSPSLKFSQSKAFSKSKAFTPSKYFTLSSPFSPSDKFTASSIFSPSLKFTQSKAFTKSNAFTPSEYFTLSSIFSPSDKFTSSNSFSPSVLNSYTFTASSPFTPSFTFSPNATKYPDGYYNLRANVGGNSKNATTAQIVITTGISMAFMGSSLALMIIYLRNKQKQLRGNMIEMDEDYLVDSGTSSDSYSYSYYTYTYTYETAESLDEYSNNYYPYSYYSEASYSDFQADLFTSDQPI